MKKILLAFLLNISFLWLGLMPLSGCAFPLRGGEHVQEYVLELEESTLPISTQSVERTLLIRDATSPGFLNTRKIAFSGSKYSIGSYQYASWIEPPPKRLTTLLAAKLEDMRLFQFVVRQTSGARADFQINMELHEFYHDITTKPGKVHIGLRVELIDLKRRKVIASSNFTRIVGVEKYHVRGAVDAFNRAVNELLVDLVTWIEAHCHA